jgi:hypothetical protein
MSFRPAVAPVRDAVGKLGGQPVWLDRPTWPLSAASGVPMKFVGQVPIPGPVFRMAYLFITDDAIGNELTFEAESGENALLVQPGGRIPGFVTVTGSPTGPSLWRRGTTWDEQVPVELLVDVGPLHPVQERELEEEIGRQEAERAGRDVDLGDGEGGPDSYSYIGGRPHFWQPEVPVSQEWRFFFQLDGADGVDGEPYALNFGGGTGYAFLSQDALEGRFCWDCV